MFYTPPSMIQPSSTLVYLRFYAATTLGILLTFAWSFGETPLPAPPLKNPSTKNEIKLLVTAENPEQALKSLNLNEGHAVAQTVCFFDTGDAALAAVNLILRAREKPGEAGESTVKLRAIPGETELSAAEQAIPLEQDWTHPDGPILSRSLNQDALAAGWVSKVAAGEVPALTLFNEEQRALITARVKDFKWENLKCYGPVEARVWRQQCKLPGFAGGVTVELWHLKNADRVQDILEVSAKGKAETPLQAQALAKQFFAAAKAAGLGEPSGQTKTKQVLDFFKPGR